MITITRLEGSLGSPIYPREMEGNGKEGVKKCVCDLEKRKKADESSLFSANSIPLSPL